MNIMFCSFRCDIYHGLNSAYYRQVMNNYTDYTLLLVTIAANAVYTHPVHHPHAAEVICGFSGQSQNYNMERPDFYHNNSYDSPLQHRNF